MPKISIVIPNYNTERFVEQAIASVVGQSERDIEIIVVDDGSSDGSKQIIQRLGDTDHRIKLIQNTRKKGVSGARNTGLEAASGEWIGFLDSDDIMAPESLAIRIRALNDYPECRWMGGDFSMIAETGEPIVDAWFQSKENVMQSLQGLVDDRGYYFIPNPVDLFLDQTVIIWTGTILLHRSLREQVGLFNETMSHGEDIDYWYRLAEHGGLLFLPQVVASYRQRDGSASKDLARLIEGNIVLYRGLANNRNLANHADKFAEKYFMALVSAIRYYREHNAFMAAMGMALKAIGFRPTSVLAWKQMLASLVRAN